MREIDRTRKGGDRAVRRLGLAALVVGLMLALPVRLSTHEVPADVMVQVYVRPDGRVLRLLVRVPLAAIRDVEFPLRGLGYLDLGRLEPALREGAKVWIADFLRLYEEGALLPEEHLVAVRVSEPLDRSFRSFDDALALVTGPALPENVDLVSGQALLDVLLEVPIASETSRFSIDPALAHLGIETLSVLHFVPPDRGERVFQYEGNPGIVRLDPRWHQAAFRFVALGFRHILDGIDHLLFILCLVIPFRRFGGLVPIVTAFTVAHSITLVASALGIAPGALWFPPLIETLIAISIVYMAFENIAGARLQRRWLIAFCFGLVHGFGFSFVLRDSLQFAGAHFFTSLLFFNVGVELGQLFVLVLAIPVLEWLFRRVVSERMGTILLSALVAHTAWHWMTDRGSALLQYDVPAPALDATLLASLLRWLMLALICVGAAWGLSGLFGHRARRPERPAPPPDADGLEPHGA